MRRLCCVILAVALYGFFACADVCAQPVPSAQLIENAAQYDGKVVSFQGEAIGDVMVRGSHCWINVNDGNNALGIWARRDLKKDILFTGSYKTKGDLIEITGVFSRACPDHGGDLDIHAHSIRRIASGRQLVERVSEHKKVMLAALLGLLVVIWILTRLKIR